jgi:hypothetical protein
MPNLEYTRSGRAQIKRATLNLPKIEAFAQESSNFVGAASR